MYCFLFHCPVRYISRVIATWALYKWPHCVFVLSGSIWCGLTKQCLLGCDTNGHTNKPASQQYRKNIRLVDEGVDRIVQAINRLVREQPNYHEPSGSFVLLKLEWEVWNENGLIMIDWKIYSSRGCDSFKTVLRSRSRWSRKYLRSGAGAEIYLFNKYILHSVWMMLEWRKTSIATYFL